MSNHVNPFANKLFASLLLKDLDLIKYHIDGTSIHLEFRLTPISNDLVWRTTFKANCYVDDLRRALRNETKSAVESAFHTTATQLYIGMTDQAQRAIKFTAGSTLINNSLVFDDRLFLFWHSMRNLSILTFDADFVFKRTIKINRYSLSEFYAAEPIVWNERSMLAVRLLI